MAWQQVTIYIEETDYWLNEPLYVALVEMARSRGLMAATATRVMAGYTKQTTIQNTHFLDLSYHLPILVTIVDRQEAIAAFLPLVREMIENLLVTCHPIQVLQPLPKPTLANVDKEIKTGEGENHKNKFGGLK